MGLGTRIFNVLYMYTIHLHTYTYTYYFDFQALHRRTRETCMQVSILQAAALQYLVLQTYRVCLEGSRQITPLNGIFCSKNRFKRAENKHKMFLLGEAQLFKFPQRKKYSDMLCQSKHEFSGTKKSSMLSTEHFEKQ